jgi:hypothetical protein
LRRRGAGFAGAAAGSRIGSQSDRDDHPLMGTSHELPQAMFVRTDLVWWLPGT